MDVEIVLSPRLVVGSLVTEAMPKLPHRALGMSVAGEGRRCPLRQLAPRGRMWDNDIRLRTVCVRRTTTPSVQPLCPPRVVGNWHRLAPVARLLAHTRIVKI